MRHFVLLSLVSVLAGCQKSEPTNGSSTQAAAAEAPAAQAEGSATAGARAKASIAPPRIGGNVAMVGDFGVEIAVHRAGLVEGVVTGPGGAELTQNVKLGIMAAARGGARESITLAFSPARGRFEGRAKAGVELGSAPVDIALEVDGAKAAGRIDLAVALEAPRLGGHLLALGGYGAELLLRPNGTVHVQLRDSAGADVNAGVELEASLRTLASANERLALTFDAPRACFSGRAKASAELAPGPLELTLRAGGKVFVGALAHAAFSAAATHGGQVIALGNYSVELVTKGKAVQAFVLDARGQAVSDANLDLKLGLGAKASSLLALKWDAPSASYRADADVALASVPLLVSLTAGGKSFVGGVASLEAAAAASAKLDADLSAKAALDAKASAPGLDAKLDVSAPKTAAAAALKAGADAGAKARAAANVQVAAPKVNIQAPKVDVSVKKTAGASAGAKTGSGAKASAGFSFGVK